MYASGAEIIQLLSSRIPEETSNVPRVAET